MSSRQTAPVNHDHVLGSSKSLHANTVAAGRIQPAPAVLENTGSLLCAVEKQADRHQDAVAVECEDRQLTYSELKQESDRIASNLAGLGVGRESLVAVYLNRSLEYVMAVTGILKAGAAYLPIDPSLPQGRVEFILDDSKAVLTVTEDEFLPRFTGRRSLLVGGLHQKIPGQTSVPQVAPNPDDLAYVIYTSGSTGRPKGVEVLHRGLFLSVTSIGRELEIGPRDTLLALTSLSFDVAVLELFMPLASGARLVLMPPTRLMSASVLEQAIRKYDPTIICGTPALWRLLIEGGWKGSRKLKAITGGETLDANLAAGLLKRAGTVWNHYGPTEVTIAATSYRVRADDLPPPIGYPLPHIHPFVVDTDGNAVGAGQVGELLIGGESLARGYRNHPELTSSRFIDFESEPGTTERVYRTGDLVRQTPDRKFEFAGRIDLQVKIRGFRIELEEIEAALNEHPDVLESAVVVREEARQEKKLVAYCRTAPSQAVNGDALRSFLVQRLPAYMLPSRFVRVDRLPLTASGKIDRLELGRRDLEGDEPDLDSESQNPVALELMHIWRQLLHVHSVSLDDNFFDLGGHSMLAARLFEEISAHFHKALPLSTLFEAPTVRSLAKAISAPVQASWSPLVPIRSGTGTPFFCVHPIGGNVLIFKKLSERMPTRPFYGLQARGLNGQERAHTSIDEMAADYLNHVRSVQTSGPYFLGGYSAGGLVAFEMARLLENAGEAVDLLVMFDTYLHPQSRPVSSAPSDSRSTPHRLVNAARRRIVQMKSAPRDKRFEILIRDLARLQSTIKLQTYERTKHWPWNPVRLDPVSGFLYAIRNYRPKPLHVRAVLFLARENAPAAALSLPSVWRALIDGPLDVRHLPIDHDRLLEAPFAAQLAACIDRCMDECRTAP